MPPAGESLLIGMYKYILYITKSCQDAPLLAVGRNGILVRGFGGADSPNITDSFLLKAPLLAAGIFTRKSRRNSYIPRHTVHRQGNKYRSVSYPVCEHVPLWSAR